MVDFLSATHELLIPAEKFTVRMPMIKLSSGCEFNSHHRQLIKSYVNQSKCHVDNILCILSQSLWSICNIRSRGLKPLWKQTPTDNSIHAIYDLVNQDGSSKNWKTISLDFSLKPVAFVDWFRSLISITNV